MIATTQFPPLAVQHQRDALLAHPLYAALSMPDSLPTFMAHHVYAVWDFMSLLKRLQRDLTCTSLPWLPPAHPPHARFVNELVLAEESDEDGRGGHRSHFELYLEAMVECGADTAPILSLIDALRGGAPLDVVVASTPTAVRPFIENTLRLAMHGETHEVAAAFFFGREDVIPGMFDAILRSNRGLPPRLRYYLERHTQLDGEVHGPIASALVRGLCDDHPVRLRQAESVAVRCLAMRAELWDSVLQALRGCGRAPAPSS